MEPLVPTSQTGDTVRGLIFAITAYLLWGGLPLYMVLMRDIPPLEVVAHRVIWSLPIAALALVLMRRTQDIRTSLTSPRMLGMGLTSGLFLSLNWVIFIWAVFNERVLDASLAYYISPLFSVMLGSLVLRERLTGAQMLAVALAGAAVLVMTIAGGAVPWAALGMTLSWGFYALCKKQLPIGPNQGFLLEVLVLTPLALGYVLWLASTGNGVFLTAMRPSWLLVGAGVVTAVPLMFYANGAKGLRLSTIGILQYIAPTGIMIVAVTFLGETFDTARWFAFAMIWAALVIYTWSMLRGLRSA